MIEINAFYYENEYYLYPGDVNDVDGLRTYVRKLRSSGGQLHVRRLGRERSLPPYFADNSISDSVIDEIDLRFVFPVRVFLMPRDEYDRNLRERIENQCRHCHRYTGDPARLEDYYYETMLFEDCPDKLNKKQFDSTGSLKTGYEPVFSVDDFWNDFGLRSRDLKEAMDNCDTKGATKIVSDILNSCGFSEYLFPALSKYSYVDGKGNRIKRYILILTGGGFLSANLVAEYFVKEMPEKLKKDWDVYPYVVRGLSGYWPIVSELDVASKPPMMRATYLEQQDSFQVFVFAEWDQEKLERLAPETLPEDFEFSEEEVPGIVFCANYLYIASIIGEDRLRGACLELTMFPASELVYDGNTVTTEEFDRLIDLQIRDKSKLLPDKSAKTLELEGVAELRNVSFVETQCDQLTFDLLLGGDSVLSYMWERDIATGVLKLDTVPEGYMLDYIRNKLTAMLEAPGSAQFFGFSYGEDGVYLDCLVWDRFDTKRALRSIAPILRPFGGTFTLTMGSESEEMRL